MAIVYKYKEETRQSDRFPKALRSGYINFNERTFEDLIIQMAEYACRLKFYSSADVVSGDWTNFFKDIYNYEEGKLCLGELNKKIETGTIKPHMAVILSFLKLYQSELSNLNSLTDRHLDYYYKDLLGFRPKKGEYGNVMLFLEARKNNHSVYVPVGTLFDAGKDKDGEQITYKSVIPVTVSQANVCDVSVFDRGEGFDLMEFDIMPTQKEIVQDYVALSSPQLLLRENMDICLKKDEKEIQLNNVSVEYTGENGWEKSVILNGLYFKIEKPIAKYDRTIHGEGFFTDAPVIRFSGLSEKIETINISVKNSKSFTLCNELGIVNNVKGARPFGIRPSAESLLMFHGLPSNLKEFKPHINWLKGKINIREKELVVEKGKYIKLKNLDGLDWNQYSAKLLDFINEKKSLPEIPEIPTLEAPITLDYSFDVDTKELSFFSILYNLYPYVKFSIDGLTCPGVLNLYFKINENASNKTSLLKWYYWIRGEWKQIPSDNIISDATCGLLKSGIIQLNVDKELLGSINEDGKMVIKIANEDGSAGLFNLFNNIEEIHTHVVEVTYNTESKGVLEPGIPLPAGTISKLCDSIQGVKKVYQLFDGEKGLQNETAAEFMCRVSEKLRHKGRAWNSWDYERLVLEKFPEVACVKTLACTTIDKTEKKNSDEVLKSNRPGNVTLLIVPNYKNDERVSALQPSASPGLLLQIYNYLSSKTSKFVNIHTQSPDYKVITVNCTLVLKKEYTDVKYYYNLLNKALVDYIAPWSDRTKDIEFDNAKDLSHISMFIAGQHYVEMLVSASLYVDGVEVINPIDKVNDCKKYVFTSVESHNLHIKLYAER